MTLSEAKDTVEAGAELEAARAARGGGRTPRRHRAGRRAERELERRRQDAERERARARDDAQRKAAPADLRAIRGGTRERRRSRDADDGFRERDRRLGAADRAVRAADQALTPELPVDGGGASVGDRVHDPVMGFRGTVVAIEGDHAEVQGPRARVRVPMARLVVDGRPAPEPPRPVERRPLRAASPEIDLRGERAEAAVAQVRTAVDEERWPDARCVSSMDGTRWRSGPTELARHPLVRGSTTHPKTRAARSDLRGARRTPRPRRQPSQPGVLTRVVTPGRTDDDYSGFGRSPICFRTPTSCHGQACPSRTPTT